MNLAVNLAMIAGGLAALIALLTPVLHRVRRVERGVGEIWRGFFGVPAQDSEPPRPGVMARLDAQDDALAGIQRQLAALQEKR